MVTPLDPIPRASKELLLASSSRLYSFARECSPNLCANASEGNFSSRVSLIHLSCLTHPELSSETVIHQGRLTNRRGSTNRIRPPGFSWRLRITASNASPALFSRSPHPFTRHNKTKIATGSRVLSVRVQLRE